MSQSLFTPAPALGVVLAKWPDAEIETDERRERSKLFRVVTPYCALSVWRFSEEDAWQDAMERITGRRK